MHDGKEIKAMIDSRGIKYSRLADHLGISRQGMTKLFNTQKINEDRKQEIISWLGRELNESNEINEPVESYKPGHPISEHCNKEIEFLKGIIENQRQTIAHLLAHSKTNSK